MHGEDIIREARSWIDTPFRHQGRSKSGLDCVGLVVAVARALDLTDYDYTAYPRRPSKFGFMQQFLAAGLVRVRLPERLPGHLVILPETSYPCHVAILTDRDKIIHAHAPDKKVVETNLSTAWLAKAHGAMAFPGVTYD